MFWPGGSCEFSNAAGPVSRLSAWSAGSRSGVRRLSWFAEGVLVYLVAVIVFGAWVRVSGSGAGCGESWPTCRGALVPANADAKTWVELSHRLTSALSGVLVVGLAVAARRLLPPAHAARRYALYSVVFVVLEGAIGAGLVAGGLVAENASVVRAAVVSLHLVNTLLLTRAAALVRSALRGAGPRAPGPEHHEALWSGRLSLLGLVLVAATGAVTALGDTLFPAGAVEAAGAFSGHWLVRLRAVHPLLATAVSAGVVLAVLRAGRDRPELGRHSLACAWACGAQVLLGAVNIGAGAPGWLQLLHLLLAQVVWILCARFYYAMRTGATAAFSPVAVPSSLYS